jgi:hypothetical protein
MIVFIYSAFCQAIQDFGPIEKVAHMNLSLQPLRAHERFLRITQWQLFQSLGESNSKGGDAADQPQGDYR